MRLGLILAALALPLPALAQGAQCTPPAQVGPIPQVRPDGEARRAPVAGYTLAASWSPEFCHGHREESSFQCHGGNTNFGFILHGLWGEARGGPPPQWCAAAPAPSPELVRRNLCMTPSAGLIAHEWAKHGSCIAASPDAYYRVSGILWRSLRWPDADALSRRHDLNAGALRAAFVALNRDWKPEMVGLDVSRTGWLREVHLCYGRNYMPARCDRRTFGPADSEPLKIWRGD